MGTLLGESAIGSIVTLNEHGWPVNYIVIQHGSPNADYIGLDGNTLLLRETLFSTMLWDWSSMNDYEHSSINGWLNWDYLQVLDEGIRNKIAQIRIPFSPGSSMGTTVLSGVDGLLTQVFLLSLAEVGFTPFFAWGEQPEDEGARLAFFPEIDGADPARIALCATEGRAADWWLRSPNPNTSHAAWGVGPDGEVHFHDTWLDIGVRPALALPSHLFVYDTGEVSAAAPPSTLPPSTPPSITVPEHSLAGSTITVSWGASTDPQGQALTYILQRSFNSTAFVDVWSGTSLSAAIFTPLGAATLAFRVLARNTTGLESAWQTSPTHTVITNSPPVISGVDGDLGAQAEAFVQGYIVTDPDHGDTITVTERLNGVQIRQYTAISGASQTFTVDATLFVSLANGQHTMTVTAIDQWGASAVRTWTFSRSENQIDVRPQTALDANDMPTRVLINVNRQIPPGAIFQVLVCNNGNDAATAWEDCTAAVLSGSLFFFTNTTKTADDWGVNVRVNVDRNGADGPCWISSISGNFDNLAGTLAIDTTGKGQS